MIPKKIFQTYKTFKKIEELSGYEDFPISKAVSSWTRFIPDYDYYFYDDDACDKFMKAKFDKRTYEAYNRLPLAVMKADLWRYCVIYYYGGIYADIDLICISNTLDFLLVDGPLLITSPEDNMHLCQWIFSAPKNSPILKAIIDLVIDRIENHEFTYTDHEIHYLTGPDSFTAGIEKYLIANNISILDDKQEYAFINIPNIKVIRKEIMHNHNTMHVFTGMCYKKGWLRKRDEYRLKYLLRVYHYDNNKKFRLGGIHDGSSVYVELEGEYDSFISNCKTTDNFSNEFIKKINIISVENPTNIFAKIDIEGEEYVWMNETQLEKYKQLIIELHDLNDVSFGNQSETENYMNSFNFKIKSIEKLMKTHYIVHAHANNNSPIDNGIPDVVELTCIRKDYFSDPPELNKIPLPMKNLDWPCDPDKQDINLNFWPFVEWE
jgi:hypothetical protein